MKNLGFFVDTGSQTNIFKACTVEDEDRNRNSAQSRSCLYGLSFSSNNVILRLIKEKHDMKEIQRSFLSPRRMLVDYFVDANTTYHMKFDESRMIRHKSTHACDIL